MFNRKYAIFGAVLFLWIAAAAVAQQTVTVTYTYSGLPLPIYGDAADVVSVVPITVPRALKMTKVTAQLQVQYPNTGDLQVYLFSPDGTRTILLQHNCSIANIDTTFDDAAASAWKDFCPVEAGRGPFRADQPLSNFNNADSSYGVWRLLIENDTSDSRSGLITGFSLTITGTTQTGPTISSRTILNAAGVTGAETIAPGEIISIYGVNLGPATAVTAGAGSLPTTLGGTTVLINSTPAPIAYAASTRVDAVVPFSVTAGSTATVQVQSGGQSSSSVPLTVTAAAPAIFTVGAFGVGRMSAMNQDGGANGLARPAPKGSVVTFYASGLGAVDPAVAAGSVPPATPLSTVTGPVSATVAGRPATILFAGLAPGIPGYYQINMEVPNDAPAGAQEVILHSNGLSSQKGATLAVQ